MSTIAFEEGVYTQDRIVTIFYQKRGSFEGSKCQHALLKEEFTLLRVNWPGIGTFGDRRPRIDAFENRYDKFLTTSVEWKAVAGV